MELVLVGILSAVLGFSSSIIAAALTNRASPYSALAERVLELEKRVTEQDATITKGRVENRLLVEHVTDLHGWIEDGAKPPPPGMSEVLVDIVKGII